MTYPTRRAYDYSVSYAISQMHAVHQQFCSHCGEQTALLDIDKERWDRLCSHCRGWTQGIFARILRCFGWELRRI